MSSRPLIVEVKRSSMEDGPGIRTVVFFKGCPLRCIFCHNPEAQHPGVEIAFSAGECIECGSCLTVCERGAVDFAFTGRIIRERCDCCGRCADVCPGHGLRRIGVYHPVASLTDLLLEDLPYYRHSGGGVTLSGGECTLFPLYLERLLINLKSENVHIVLQTSGQFNFRTLQRRILPYVDVILFDVKFGDAAIHKRFTGVSNTRILENLRRLICESGVEIRARIPLVPGITATQENITAVAAALCDLGAGSLTFVPYNPLGLDKYPMLGRPVPALPQRFMTVAEEQELSAILCPS
jgi:pyruvate formate lyase activating enzyme